MTPRRRLAADLTANLGDGYRVAARTATPDQIDRGTLAVRVMPASIAPAPQTRGLSYTLTVWVLTHHEDPDKVDDVLDDALDDLLGALLRMQWLTFDTAERGVMEDRWHGYRLTVTCYATIQED